MRVLRIVLIIVVSAYILGAGLLYFLQRSLLYFPSQPYEHQFENIDLINDDERIKVIVLNPNRSKAIIYFGGNAEPVIFNEEPFRKNFSNHTVYLMNYRAYGGSSGQPSEQALFSDALALYDHVAKNHQSVSAFGRSLGSGVASYLATQRTIDALALITPYDSIASVAQKRFPFYPASLLLKDHYNSKRRAPNISARVLIIMAELDTIIPNWHSLELQKEFSNSSDVRAIQIKGADHNNVSLAKEYFEELVRFFR